MCWIGVLPEESGENSETWRAAAGDDGIEDDAPLLQAAKPSTAMRTRGTKVIFFNGKVLLIFVPLYAKVAALATGKLLLCEPL
jgi:hypothetical protein